MGEKTLTHATLGFLVREGEIFLGVKADKIGAGCYMGYGGGIENEETPEQCMIRELDEEADIKTSPKHITKVALLYFHNTKSDGSTFTCKVHVFFIHAWQGRPKETNEIRDPEWFSLNRLPWKNMMPADKEWLHLVLEGKKIIGKAAYGPFQRELIGPFKFKEIKKFPMVE